MLGFEVPEGECTAMEVDKGSKRSELVPRPVEPNSERGAVGSAQGEIVEPDTVGTHWRLAGAPIGKQRAPSDPVDLAAIVAHSGRSLEGGRELGIEDLHAEPAGNSCRLSSMADLVSSRSTSGASPESIGVLWWA